MRAPSTNVPVQFMSSSLPITGWKMLPPIMTIMLVKAMAVPTNLTGLDSRLMTKTRIWAPDRNPNRNNTV